MSEAKPDRSEMWKAIKWVAIAFVACLIAFGVWKAWSIVTAPARVVEDAAGSVKSSVGNVVNRLDVKLESQKSFNRAAEKSFKHLNDLSPTEPDSLKDRTFRLANLKGSENQVCKLTYDFGEGAVPVIWRQIIKHIRRQKLSAPKQIGSFELSLSVRNRLWV